MAEVDDSLIYQGFWINHDHGAVLGTTITMDQQASYAVEALIAIVVAAAATSAWNLLLFAVHQVRQQPVSSHPQSLTPQPYKFSFVIRNAGFGTSPHIRPSPTTTPTKRIHFTVLCRDSVQTMRNVATQPAPCPHNVMTMCFRGSKSRPLMGSALFNSLSAQLKLIC